jgi:anti-sigma regulatory factor (Ser/Thr protein kinase)
VHLDILVPASPETLRRVRQALDALALPPALLVDARLLTSELVTNSIRHSGLGPHDYVRVRADWSGTRLRVDVFDRAGVRPPSHVAGSIRPPPGAQSGWGLYMVDRVARRWGAVPGRYWFELEVEQGDDPEA